ncbi:hypothetical protein [Marilutibacter alkalisoli]|uniref:Uncharacterized protein n=1 Tax=Marilutibacter alkalisoli TaxID=2591633 RepID=A0A514BRM6_9GAMM|nr:hypothetical protein [Lysobacter alkalisoli]QDH70052.1 hypothetical protein FKV23_08030 [Lysobacter alkalisoli]
MVTASLKIYLVMCLTLSVLGVGPEAVADMVARVTEGKTMKTLALINGDLSYLPGYVGTIALACPVIFAISLAHFIRKSRTIPINANEKWLVAFFIVGIAMAACGIYVPIEGINDATPHPRLIRMRIFIDAISMNRVSAGIFYFVFFFGGSVFGAMSCLCIVELKRRIWKEAAARG